jgi:hypothetical protein
MKISNLTALINKRKRDKPGYYLYWDEAINQNIKLFCCILKGEPKSKMRRKKLRNVI